MNRIILLCFYVLKGTVSFSQSWTQITDFPGTQRDDGAVFTIANKAYCISGLEVGWQCTGNGYEFDSTSDTWLPMASLPSGKERQYATAFSYGGNGYLLGGLYCNNICMSDFWMYTVATDTWSSLSDFPGTARQGMSNFCIKNKVYVIGGRDQSNTTLKEVWEYDFITTNWTQKNNLPFAGMWRGAAFSIDTIGYVCYGMNSNANSFNHSMYQYDNINDSWTVVPNLSLPARNYISCAVTDKKVCLYGGQDSLNLITNDLYVFNPADTSLTLYNGIPTIGRKGGMAFSLNDVFYITTGLDVNSMRVKETWKNTGFVGLKENESKESFNVYPNPANDKLNLHSNVNSIIKLYNQLGELLFEIKMENQFIELNTSEYVNGIYYLVMKSEMSFITRKIEINH